MARRDAIAAALLLLVAAVAVREAGRLPFGVVRNPGEGFFPWWLGIILGGLALVVLAGAVRGRRPEPVAASGRVGRVLALLAALGAYALALEPLGYPLCTFLLMLGTVAPRARGQIVPSLAFALAAAGGSYLLFAVWLSVPLPAGLLAR
ncbi:MAG: tripartite tricarboxylate transporter TctB family protein [Candidatus Rokuibacteriota bacterium]